jgi:luciferase family oxidoreductase group 1
VTPLPLSILDLVVVPEGRTVGETIAASVTLAQRAEAWGYERVWYAEHHNMEDIASSATSVLIAHVAAQTRSIRVGSGGVMLPNHSPLVVAEQFGTLASIHSGRIDLGLGRAPGGDPETFHALRRDPRAAEHFADDVLELKQLLGQGSPSQRVHAMPGRGTHVPLYILGSSLYGARLAARLGLPYAFASHFAPALLTQAVGIYREEFEPSDQLHAPWVIAGMNAIAADQREDAEAAYDRQLRRMTLRLLGRHGRGVSPDHPGLLESPVGRQVREMLRHVALGTGPEVAEKVRDFAAHARADEVMVVTYAGDFAARLRSYELLAEAMGPG